MNYSLPAPILKRVHIDANAFFISQDQESLAGLHSAGFALDSGPDAAGLFIKYLSRGGGYYIDTGTSALVADGSIRIKKASVKEIKEHAVAFEDGSELPADEIILATGYTNMQDTAEEIFGKEVADKAGPVWGFDQEGEMRGVWRRTGQEGFWYMAGNLNMCRFYSRYVALAIKGQEEGMWKWGKS